MYKKTKWHKFIMLSILMITMISTVFSGCSSQTVKTVSISPSDPVINDSYRENVPLLTIKGERIQQDDERLTLFPTLGFGFLSPTSWFDYSESMTFVAVDNGICIGFLPSSILSNLASMSEEEIANLDPEVFYGMQHNYLKIFFDSSNNDENPIKSENKLYQSLEKIVAYGDRTYYCAYNPKLSVTENKPTAADETAYQALIASIDEVKDSLIIFPQVEAPSNTAIETKDIQALQAQDMAGNTVTSDVFTKFDLTMINIWATWCGPCVSEMPDLAKLYKELPNNVNLIAICSDADTEKEITNKILQDSNAEFATLCGNEAIRNGLLANVFSYPTTVFVDKNGAIVGEPLFGALSSSEYMQAIESRLELVK